MQKIAVLRNNSKKLMFIEYDIILYFYQYFFMNFINIIIHLIINCKYFTLRS